MEDFNKILSFRLKEQYDYLTKTNQKLDRDRIRHIKYKDNKGNFVLCEIDKIEATPYGLDIEICNMNTEQLQ